MLGRVRRRALEIRAHFTKFLCTSYLAASLSCALRIWLHLRLAASFSSHLIKSSGMACPAPMRRLWTCLTSCIYCLVSPFRRLCAAICESSEDDDQDYPHLSLQEVGYEFDKRDGKLYSRTSRAAFHFTDQRSYERVGKAVCTAVYELLVSQEIGLSKQFLQCNSASDGQGFFFADPDFSNKKHLLVLIHGSGKVRAGQWSRRLIMNESIYEGSQLPYIRRAHDRNWGVIVMNTNQKKDESGRAIYNSRSPELHACAVWKQAISSCKATHIAVVAHSYGGLVTACLIDNFKDFFERRVRAIAFTDSVHAPIHLSDTTGRYLQKVGKNWVRSSTQLDTPLAPASGYYTADAVRVSAGTPEHERTSSSSINSVFEFIYSNFIHQ